MTEFKRELRNGNLEGEENVWPVCKRNARHNRQRESLGAVKEIRPEGRNGRLDMCSPGAGA